MIEIISGKLGGGKTLFAVRKMMEHLAKGGTVVSNVLLHKEGCEKFLEEKWGVGVDFETQFQTLPEEVVESWHEHIPLGESPDLPVLCVIDEAHLWLNSRDTMKSNKEAMKHLSQSRKLCIDFLFIVQDPKNLDTQVNRLAQHQIRCRDMRKFRIAKLGVPWPFPQLLISRWDYNMKDMLDSEMWWIDKRVFACYKTDALLRPIIGLPTVKRGKITVTKKKKKMKPLLFALVIIGGLFCMVKMGMGLFHFLTDSKAAVATHGPLVPGPAPLTKSQASTPFAGTPALPSPPLPAPLRQEQYRGFSDGVLLTDVDTYERGDVKIDGTVQRVSDQAAVMRRWDGTTLVIIAHRNRGSSAAAVASVVASTPVNLEPVIAKMPEQVHISEPEWMKHTSAPATNPRLAGR